jgi:hypothetical protein
LSKIIIEELPKKRHALSGLVKSMERFTNYVSMIIELFLMAVIYVIALPFRLLYNLSNKLVSR